MARLPRIGADTDHWGEVLNTFLRVAHHEDGTLKRTYPVLNVRDFGAKGDGLENDTTAFQEVANAINAAGGGIICIPPGEYIVGRQTPLLEAEDIIYIAHCERPVLIQGVGATLKAAHGLKVGHFHGQKASAYWGMIRIEHNVQVTIRDLELDGNISQLELGARSDSGALESAAYGIYSYWNQNVLIENVYTHHHGLDGIVIGYPELVATDGTRPHTLINVISEYNARQGLSWVGGAGVTAINCKFNFSGRAQFHTSPAAGLDIEPEGGVCGQGYFVGCEFVHNMGAGMTAGYIDGGNTTFKQCLFWGTDYYAVFTRRAPSLVFEDCTIYGSCIAGSPRGAFIRCHFEDRDYQSEQFEGVYRGAAVVILEGEQLVLDDCVIIAHQTKGVYAEYAIARTFMRNTTIIHRYDGLADRDFQSLLRGCVLERVRFEEDIQQPPQTAWYIAVEAVEVVDSVHVQGPSIKWFNWSWGLTGALGTTQTVSQPKLALNRNMNQQGAFQGQVIIAVLSEPPTAGSWNTGDMVFNQTPRPGGNIGWVCITGGTPGSWKPFGMIDS